MVCEIPNVSERGRYSIAQTTMLLGISRATLYRAIKLGSKRGGIDSSVRRDNGRRQIIGREILRYWRG